MYQIIKIPGTGNAGVGIIVGKNSVWRCPRFSLGRVRVGAATQ